MRVAALTSRGASMLGSSWFVHGPNGLVLDSRAYCRTSTRTGSAWRAASNGWILPLRQPRPWPPSSGVCRRDAAPCHRQPRRGGPLSGCAALYVLLRAMPPRFTASACRWGRLRAACRDNQWQRQPVASRPSPCPPRAWGREGPAVPILRDVLVHHDVMIVRPPVTTRVHAPPLADACALLALAGAPTAPFPPALSSLAAAEPLSKLEPPRSSPREGSPH
jgi:hypothetical protein